MLSHKRQNGTCKVEGRILMKFTGNVDHGTRKRLFYFGGDMGPISLEDLN